MQNPALIFFAVTLPFSLWAAWGDLKYMKITNRFNIVLAATFVVVGILVLPFGDYLTRLAIGLGALAAGFVLNALRLMGGGDAKYIAAFAPFIAPGDWNMFFFVLALCLLAAVAVHRAARAIGPVRGMVADWKSWEAGKYFPMGLGLSGALSFYLAIRAFSLPFAAG